MQTLNRIKRPLVLLPPGSITPGRENLRRMNLFAHGILPPVSGGAPQGYNDSGDILTQTVDGRPLNEIWADYIMALQLHNQGRNALVSLLTFPVTEPIDSVQQMGNATFEKASEYGTPRKIRLGGYFELGYDFEDWDIGIGFTWKFLRDAVAAQLDALNNSVFEADNRLIFEQVLRAIFNNINRTTDIRLRAIPVYPFYNGDTTVPPGYKNNTFTAPHSHYMVSGAAVVDAGDMEDLEAQIVEHGYGVEGGASLVLLVNRQQLNTIRTFRISTGAAYDFVPSAGQPPFLLPTNTGGIAGGQPAPTRNGVRVAGQYGNWTIIEDSYIPAGYMFGFATGGQFQATNPVGFREHANSAFRGLLLVKGQQPDYPLIDSYYMRSFGTGVRHRGAGAVMQVKATGTYTIPASYV